jgi:hypothetical protein
MGKDLRVTPLPFPLDLASFPEHPNRVNPKPTPRMELRDPVFATHELQQSVQPQKREGSNQCTSRKKGKIIQPPVPFG